MLTLYIKLIGKGRGERRRGGEERKWLDCGLFYLFIATKTDDGRTVKRCYLGTMVVDWTARDWGYVWKMLFRGEQECVGG